MAKVRLLEKTVAERIAAGEVVERPASIVKELVENSLDAGATRITVDIKSGGIKSLRVSDNGCGMAADDMSVAIQRFATSKISAWDDLASLSTLGFRGEALPSIAAVSRLSIKSCTGGSEEGAELYVEGAGVPLIKPCSCPPGTVIEVNDLFYNTPARLKFLRSPVAEATNIIDLLGRMAVARPEVHFRLLSNDKEVFSFPVGMSIDQRLAKLWKIPDGTLIPILRENGNMAVDGFVALPSFTRNNRNNQLLLLNGRIIKSSNLSQAIQEGFSPLVPRGRFPVGLVRIFMPPDSFDVNVHPNKLEVRFIDTRPIFSMIYGAVAQALEENQADTVHQSHIDAARGRMATSSIGGAGVDTVVDDVPVARPQVGSFTPRNGERPRQHYGTGDERSFGLIGILNRLEAVNTNQLAMTPSEKALVREGRSTKRLPPEDFAGNATRVRTSQQGPAPAMGGYTSVVNPPQGGSPASVAAESASQPAFNGTDTISTGTFNGADTLSIAPPAPSAAKKNQGFSGSDTIGVASVAAAPGAAPVSRVEEAPGEAYTTAPVAGQMNRGESASEESYTTVPAAEQMNRGEYASGKPYTTAPVAEQVNQGVSASEESHTTASASEQMNRIEDASGEAHPALACADGSTGAVSCRGEDTDAQMASEATPAAAGGNPSGLGMTQPVSAASEQLALLGDTACVRPKKSRFELFGQVHNTFIVGLVDGELWVIDQHTAHERLNYERLGHLDPLKSQSQLLLVPEVLEFSPVASEYLASQPEELAEFGFVVEPFGPQTFQLRAVPSALSERRVLSVFRELIEELVAGSVSCKRTVGENLREKLRAMTSCKAAVKAGDPLSPQDMQRLIEDMLEVEHSRYCPHGRPTRVKLDKATLERLFHR